MPRMTPRPKRFGIFMAPFHPPSENPTLALARDMELVQWLDQLHFDEAWIGEHHSAGWETISAPDIFIAIAAERTKHIKLGTGVFSLPYHHPLIVADRMVLLDHLTRGRVLFGVGPGALVTDALMLGIEPARTRPMMEQALDTIIKLFTQTEPLTVETDWFTLRNAVLQLRPFTRPYMPIAIASMQSPAGPALAGKHGAGVLSIGVMQGLRGAVDLKGQWQIAEDAAGAAGRTVNRDEWRLVIPVHLADTREEAIAHIHQRATNWLTQYQRDVLSRPLPAGIPEELAVETMIERGAWIVGTPDDCIAAMERLEEASGGFGGLLVMAQDWTTREQEFRSYELLARYVMPHFNSSRAGLDSAYRFARDHQPQSQTAMSTAIEKAFEAHEAKPAV